MAVTAYYRERASGGNPRTLLSPSDTVDFGSAPTGVVVILSSIGAVEDFNGCKIGGSVGDGAGSGYTGATFALTDTGVGSSGQRVYKYFGSGIPTGAQPVHYSKTNELGSVNATILVFDSETDISAPTISGAAPPIARTVSGTTSGRKSYVAGYIEAGSGNAVTPTGGTDTPVLDINGTYGRGVVLSKDSGSGSTTLNGTTSATGAVLAAFEAVPGGGTSATASGVTVTSAASIVVGSASGQAAATASGVTFTAAGSLVAGSASGVINGTLNFQDAGFEFGRRTGAGISTFALDNGASYRYTIHADALTLGSALHTSAAITLDSAGKLPNYVGSAVAPGTQYRIVAIRQADGEAATFRMTAT